MPAATVPGFLVDAFGRPAVYQPGQNLYKRSWEDEQMRPKPPSHFGDYSALFGAGRYRELVSACRALASRGLVSALLKQKADYVAASHFRPRFCGDDTEYGAAALEVLTDALKICNLRGPRYTWRESWRLNVQTRATDGRFFVLLSEWGDTGWPALQFLEGHRIGQRDDKTIVTKDDTFTRIVQDDGSVRTVRGAYAGYLIQNGVIYNDDGTEIAYRVLGATPKDDEDISARDMLHVARPTAYSEASTPPELAPALLDFLAIDAAQTAQLDQQISDSKLTFVEKNELGRQDPSLALAGMSTGGLDGTPTEMLDRGTWRYVKSGKGGIDVVKTERPSKQWMDFDLRVASRAAAAIRWRVEMLDPAQLRGAATRAFQDQINTAIADEFSMIEPAACRVLGYFTSKLTKLGLIPQHDEWMCWGIARPPWFEVDRASARIDLEEVAGGRVSMTDLHERDGSTTVEVYTKRAAAYELALATQKQHPEVPLEIILGDMGAAALQRDNQIPSFKPGAPDAAGVPTKVTPNEDAADAEAPDAPEGADSEDSKKD